MAFKEDVQKFYDDYVLKEWTRIKRHPIEFEINMRYIKRYLKKGDKILDIGGGPGRYSLSLAEDGYDVTLLDLSPINVEFAANKASESGLKLKTLCADACVADTLIDDKFDIVLLMGPLYHLPDETERILAVDAALNLLKSGGIIFTAFISSAAMVYYYLLREPSAILNESEKHFFDIFTESQDFSGLGFTHNHFISPSGVEAFMSRFPLEKLHILGSEGILSLREKELLTEPKEVLNAWIDLAEKVCEKEESIWLSNHLLYIGRKL